MCGLLALRTYTAGHDLVELGRRGLDRLAHRGPDDSNWTLIGDSDGPPTFLGHQRLSILDLSRAGRQPMTCAASGNTLVFNGEIYNFIELRKELEALGYPFHTDSDTEVILQGWRAWGENLFARCNGMWAIVLLESASGDLIYCRDRLGVKPLYLRSDGLQILLASEIRAIAAIQGTYPTPNPGTIFDFLTTGISDHGSETFFDGIRAVPPGWIYRVSPQGRISGQPYHHWQEADRIDDLQPAEVRDLVREATLLRLRSDVPTVSLLSGGLDSSILTAISLNAGNQPRTHFAGAFSYGYTDIAQTNHDETRLAASLMRELGHADRHHIHCYPALPTEDELFDLVTTQEEPFSTPSILASYRMYRAINAAGYKVALSGEGSDELFGGYVNRYFALAARDALRNGRLATLLGLLGRRAVTLSPLLNRLAWDLPAPMIGTLLRRHRPSVGVMADGLWQDHKQRLDALCEDQRANLIQRLQSDVLGSNLPMILRMTDRNSMRFGVEVRSPFIDYRLISRGLATSAHARIGDFHGKTLLRQAFAGQLPARVLWQRKTTGFGHAEQFLVNRMPLQQALASLPASIKAFLDIPKLHRELARSPAHSTLWLAVSVALWYRSIYA